MRSVALVVVHFRALPDTLECLESALRLEVPGETQVKIIVVENCSGDDSWQRLLQWSSERGYRWHVSIAPDQLPQGIDEGFRFRFDCERIEVVFLRSSHNLGYAAGCNHGIRFALGDPATTDLWVLNNDLLFEPGALKYLLRESEGNRAAIYGATLLYHDDPGVIQAAGGAVYLKAIGRSRHCGKRKKIADYPNHKRRLDYVIGADMFFSRRVAEIAGLIPEEFFLYFEETEWCFRARERGIEMLWVPEAQLIHKEGKSTGAAGRFRKLSDLSFRYIVRNSLLFTSTRFPYWFPTVFLFNLYETFRFVLMGDRKKWKVFWDAVSEYRNIKVSPKKWIRYSSPI